MVIQKKHSLPCVLRIHPPYRQVSASIILSRLIVVNRSFRGNRCDYYHEMNSPPAADATNHVNRFGSEPDDFQIFGKSLDSRCSM
jgi:hypothetical protein